MHLWEQIHDQVALWTLAPPDSCAGLQFSPALSGGKTCIIAFLAILTTLEMILANQALDLRDDSGRSTIDDSTGSYYINTNRANTATAGEASRHLLHCGRPGNRG